MSKPSGYWVRLIADDRAGEHICAVRDLLSVQFTASYEVARNDGGWTEVTQFLFYTDEGVTWENYED